MFYGLSLLLAFLTESSVEYVLGTPMDKIPALKPHKWLLMYAGLLVGVGLCFFFELDLVAPLYGDVSWVGQLLTGLAVGRGSNYVHDLYSRYVKPIVFGEVVEL